MGRSQKRATEGEQEKGATEAAFNEYGEREERVQMQNGTKKIRNKKKQRNI